MERSLQEKFWAGKFGDEYVDRNEGPLWVASNIALFSRILQRTEQIDTVCELGANIGMNLTALHMLLPHALLTGVEINQKAAEILGQLPYVKVEHRSIYEVTQTDSQQYDFVFTKGVLIHQAPESLSEAYNILYQTSKQYIMICEYYNPTPVEIEYRGNKSVLFKRDFAGEMLEKYPDLKLLDYGFLYHKDRQSLGDEFTWFLMKKDETSNYFG